VVQIRDSQVLLVVARFSTISNVNKLMYKFANLYMASSRAGRTHYKSELGYLKVETLFVGFAGLKYDHMLEFT
jgi:hypothetical protein